MYIYFAFNSQFFIKNIAAGSSFLFFWCSFGCALPERNHSGDFIQSGFRSDR